MVPSSPPRSCRTNQIKSNDIYSNYSAPKKVKFSGRTYDIPREKVPSFFPKSQIASPFSNDSQQISTDAPQNTMKDDLSHSSYHPSSYRESSMPATHIADANFHSNCGNKSHDNLVAHHLPSKTPNKSLFPK